MRYMGVIEKARKTTLALERQIFADSEDNSYSPRSGPDYQSVSPS
jgi:hypothetical protein